MMDIPTVPAAPAANSASNGKPAAQGTEGTFQTALSEESLKQTQGSEGKASKEQDDESLPETDPETDPAMATATVGAVNSQPPKTPETLPAEGVVAVDPAASGIAAMDSEATVAREAAGTERTGLPPAARETVHQAPATAGVAPASVAPVEPASNAARPTAVDITAGREQSPAAIPATAAGQATAPKAKGLFQGPAATAASEVARQQIAQLQQQMAGRPDMPETKTGTSGLLEASFAGILHPPAAQGQSLRGGPAHELPVESVGVLPDGEQADASTAIRLTTNGEADADLAETLLKQSAGRSEALEPGNNRGSGDVGQPSVFDGTLAAAGAGKNPVEGLSGPLQGSAATTATFAATSPNQEVRILDQVLQQLPLNRIGDQNRIVIRLHPEELGEVKLDLVMDKDQLKAHLVAQTQQVQDILEKHLPRLQEALHNQGVKLDSIQVSVDSQRNQGREFNDRNQQPAPFARYFGQHRATTEPIPAVAAAGSSRPGQGGLSLRI
jgi:flagellar hook-length control protein FliK